MRLVFEHDLRRRRAEGADARRGVLSCLLDLRLPCNMRCAACPDPTCGVPLSDAAVTFLARAVARTLESRAVSQLDVALFGGEPLLELDRVLALSRLLLRACTAAAIAYQGHLITNGTLLDLVAPATLADAGLRRLQVTLEGPAAVHDRKRPMRDGGASWERIVNGVARMRGAVEVVVRAPSGGLTDDVEHLVLALQDHGELAAGGAAALYVAPPAPYAQQARDLVDLFPLLATAAARPEPLLN